jgi:hypothetical protein
MTYIAGDQYLVQQMMPMQGSLVKVSQRIRLEPQKLDPVLAKLDHPAGSGYCILLARPNLGDEEKLGTGLIEYLLSKNAAGIYAADQGSVYLFPPHEASEQILRGADPRADARAELRGNVLVVLTLS